MLTVDELAVRLDRHPDYIRRLIREGKIKAEKKAGAWFITDKEAQRIEKIMSGSKYD